MLSHTNSNRHGDGLGIFRNLVAGLVSAVRDL